jgi:catechol 2,3-dioxygenase-like lactoylglutathione lyase family enzyme
MTDQAEQSRASARHGAGVIDMSTRLEHANIVVRDIDAIVQFLSTAFPDFAIRRDGRREDGTRWVHIGTELTYLALSTADAVPSEPWEPYSGKPGVNHLGFEVDDADALRERMRAAGYWDSTVPNAHPHRKRVYFIDPEGNDWEFVEYYSDDPRKRNDYELPG